ncbi:MAG: hypothetical protein C9356_11875 [Oleiphilus sp.]|nr:MAG: hypothetical protein C9356_11875 [Oleiphilus sp.]
MSERRYQERAAEWLKSKPSRDELEATILSMSKKVDLPDLSEAEKIDAADAIELLNAYGNRQFGDAENALAAQDDTVGGEMAALDFGILGDPPSGERTDLASLVTSGLVHRGCR